MCSMRSENKSADQLRGNCEADHLCLLLCIDAKKIIIEPQRESISLRFLPRLETNQDIQAQKITRGLKVRIGLSYYLCSAHQLRGNRPCFCTVCKNNAKTVFFSKETGQ